jgi:predicted transcriptional regulator
MKQIIMSIKPCYVQKIISGEKTVELRSRKLNVQNGARMWIYSTLPKGCVEVVATIQSIEYNHPDIIWARYANELAITYEDFQKYVHDNEMVSAIKLLNVTKVNNPLTLETIRSCIQKFHPPQFFSHISANMELSDLLIREGFEQNMAF